VGAAVVFQTLAFETDPAAAGPLSSLIAFDVVVFAIFSWLVYGEKISTKQWLVTLLLMAGLVLVACGRERTTGAELGLHGFPKSRFLGLFWATLAMLGFCGINVSIRICTEHHVSILGGLVLRLCGMAIMGFALLALAAARGSLSVSLLSGAHSSWVFWYVSSVPACGQVLGTAALAKAFKHPSATVFVVILSSCPVIVFGLTAAINRKLPTTMQTCGMAVAVLATALFTILADSGEQQPSTGTTMPVEKREKSAQPEGLTEEGDQTPTTLASVCAGSQSPSEPSIEGIV